MNKRLIVFCIYDLFEVIQNVRHVKDTTRILQFLAQTAAKCAPYCVRAAFGRVALGSHGVEWTCDLQFQFYKRWFSIERNMSQQTLIIVFFILLVDIFVNEALAVFSRQVPGDYIWSVHRLSVIHAWSNYEQSTSASDLYWDRLNWYRLINIAITKRWPNVCDQQMSMSLDFWARHHSLSPKIF